MNVLVDKNKLENHVAQRSLSGSEGTCFVKGNKIIKVYYENRKYKDYIDFTQYSSEFISFPSCYLFNRFDIGEIVGEVMDYIPKKAIYYALDYDTSVVDFLKFYKKILQEIGKYKEILMVDLCSPNILFDGITGFSIIDTTRWKINSHYDYASFNQKVFGIEVFGQINDIIGYVPNMIFRNSLYRLGNDGINLYKLLIVDSHDYKSAAELFGLMGYLMKKTDNIEQKTFDDVENYIKILKKG